MIPISIEKGNFRMNKKRAIGYVDGTFDAHNKELKDWYACGWVLFIEGENEMAKGGRAERNPEFAASRQVAGEILGATLLIENAIELGVTDLLVCYDYQGIGNWATGSWKTNKRLTKEYVAFIQEASSKINLHWKWVGAAHNQKAGAEDPANVLADFIAQKSLNTAGSSNDFHVNDQQVKQAAKEALEVTIPQMFATENF